MDTSHASAPAEGAILPRFPGARLTRFDRAEGVYLWDRAGRRYLDAISGALVVNLGYGHPRLIEALTRQLGRLSYAHDGRYRTEPAETLAEGLSGLLGNRYRVYFCSSGSETVEAALRIGHVYHRAHSARPRTGVISGRRSYHGSSLGALRVTGLERVRRPFDALAGEAVHLNECFPLPADAAPDQLSEVRDAAREVLDRHPDAGVVLLESMSANALGAVLLPQGHLSALQRAAAANDQLLVLDEIATSVGRTGADFAFQHTELQEPDMICLSKGIGVGYVNLGAVLVHERVAETVTASGTPLLGHTYNGHPGACAVGREVLQILREEDMVRRNRQRGDRLLERLRSLASGSAHIREVRGRGLLIAIDIGRDGEPFPPSERVGIRAYEGLLARGLMTLPGSGSIDGLSGDHVLIAPPFVATDDELDRMVEIIAKFFDDFEREVVVPGASAVAFAGGAP